MSIDRSPVSGSADGGRGMRFMPVVKAVVCSVSWLLALVSMFFGHLFEPDPHSNDTDVLAAVQVLVFFGMVLAVIATLVFPRVRAAWIPCLVFLLAGVSRLVSLA
ncbi:hypothetical protein [Microtetraspora niveoalba]|uniref:hypothetical protein n=1 Tax=Microtetraspora niveoalba TaxID=46175 RepID=UPI00082CA434|nr:hypothetical protein [Microtetraspora niveoalba]